MLLGKAVAAVHVNDVTAVAVQRTDGKLVAKVKVSSVQKDRAVANVVPGWQLGEIFEGDLAIPAHPAS